MRTFRTLLTGSGIAAVALAAVAFTGTANAGDVYWSVGVHAAPGVNVGVSNAPRPYYGRPVVVAPPVYQAYPAPVYYPAPQPVYNQVPVYYPPAPVYYRPPAVYVPPPVYYRPGYGHGYGRGHWDHRGPGRGPDHRR